MTLPPKLGELRSLFALLEDRAQRIDLLIDTADRYEPVPPDVATRPYDAGNLVPHCESQVYVWAVPRDEVGCDFYFAVENPQGISARAMAVILGESLAGRPHEEIEAVPQDLPYELFGQELSMGKNMGLVSMIGTVQRLSAEHCRAEPS